MSKKKALYVDMDGTLARFHDADKTFIEAMWMPGFYVNLKPFENICEAIEKFVEHNSDVEVYVLSAVLDTEPPFVVDEKNAWLDLHLSAIDKDHRIFCPAGEDKSVYMRMDCDNYLLDDYNKNLYEFEAAGHTGIKFHNDVNHRGLGEFGGSKGSLWEGAIVHYYDSPEKICSDLETVLFGKYKEENERYFTPDKEDFELPVREDKLSVKDLIDDAFGRCYEQGAGKHDFGDIER